MELTPPPKIVHVRGDNDLCDWCRVPWPCSFEQEVDYERWRQAQVCQCGHERSKHHRSVIGLDGCTVTDFEHGPPWRGCPCASFRRAVSSL